MIVKRAACLAALVVLARCATSTAPELSRDVDQILQRHHRRTIAVAYVDLRDGTSFFHNEREAFHAASTMKVPVMLGIFEAVSRGALRLEQPVRVRNEFASIVDGSPYRLNPKDDSDDEMYGFVGREVPLQSLVRHMIVRSSNLATNNVIELIGAKQVMALMQRIGANDIRVLRGVEDQKAFDAGMNNTTTAYDLMLIFRALGESRPRASGLGPHREVMSEAWLSGDASQKMIDVLAAQEFNRGIPAGLPRGTRVAHKTGDITRVAHDAGLVFAPDGSSYVLVVLTRGFNRLRDAEKVMAQISRAVWRGRNNLKPPASHN